MPILSKTELEKGWGNVSLKRAEAQEPARLSDLCHVKEPHIRLKYKRLPSELDEEFRDIIYNQLLQGKIIFIGKRCERAYVYFVNATQYPLYEQQIFPILQ